MEFAEIIAWVALSGIVGALVGSAFSRGSCEDELLIAKEQVSELHEVVRQLRNYINNPNAALVVERSVPVVRRHRR